MGGRRGIPEGDQVSNYDRRIRLAELSDGHGETRTLLARRRKSLRWCCTIAHCGLVLCCGFSSIAPALANSEESQSTERDEGASPETIIVIGKRESKSTDGYKPETVATTGPWGGRSIQDVPYSITVLPSEFIENTVARNLDSLFTASPLVQAGQSQDVNNIAQATLRGFNVARAYVNGVQNNNLGMGVFVEEIGQLELLNGLSGFLYGASPVGGVINYQLKRPTEYDLRNITLGNYGGEQFYAHADFGGALGAEGRFGYRLNLLYQDGDTPIDHQSLQRGMVSIAADWRPTDDMALEFFLSTKDYELNGRQFQFFLNGNVPPAIDGSKLYAPKDTYLDVESRDAGATFAYAPSDDWAIRAAYAFKKDTRSLVYPLGSLLPGDTEFQFTLYGGRNGAKTNGGYFYVDRAFSTGPVKHRLTIGANGHFFVNSLAIQSNGFPSFFSDPYVYALSDRSVVDLPVPDWDIDDSYTIVNARSRNLNGIIGDDIAFGEKWSMLLGLNLSNIRSESFDFATGAALPGTLYDETALTPTASLLFKPHDNFTAYASYMESIEQGAIVGPTYANANQILEPLTSQQFEIGAKANLKGVLLTGALFQIEKASERSDDGTMMGLYVQDGLQVHRGLELSASGKPFRELSVIAGLTLLDAEIRESADPALNGRRPNWVAQEIFKVYAEYFPDILPGVTFTGGLYYTGEQYQDPLNTRTIPDYMLVDVGARYKTELFGQTVVMRVNVTNVGDKRYWAATSPGAPRTAAFSITGEF